MANHSCGRRRPPISPQTAPPEPVSYPEPEVRRWPHPTEVSAPEDARLQPDAVLHHLHCSLSYQNQLLADIKALLQELCQSQPQAEK